MADEAAQEANINQTQTNNDVSNDSNVDSSLTYFQRLSTKFIFQ